MTEPDPVTAHGRTLLDAVDDGLLPIAHLEDDATQAVVLPNGLARCIEDAATLAQMRQLAADITIGTTCPTCGYVTAHHADGCPLGCLLALLDGDGTP